jgi:hypothetical protein
MRADPVVAFLCIAFGLFLRVLALWSGGLPRGIEAWYSTGRAYFTGYSIGVLNPHLQNLPAFAVSFTAIHKFAFEFSFVEFFLDRPRRHPQNPRRLFCINQPSHILIPLYLRSQNVFLHFGQRIPDGFLAFSFSTRTKS